MGKEKRKRKRKAAKLPPEARDRHILYEAAVQSPEADIRFFRRVFKKHAGRPARRMREDFCGTALLSCTWVGGHRDNEAWGVDLHRPTLDWGIEHHARPLAEAGERLHLLCEDVLSAETPPADIVCALNFSYWIFKRRPELLAYFRAARQATADDGVFVVDAFGGSEAMDTDNERRKVNAHRRPDGTKVPGYTYVWDQAKFNVVDHSILCHIHFELRDRSKIKRAFTYDWRFWTLPEIQDLMIEAGFSDTHVYMEGWDDDEDEPDGIFRRKRKAENDAGWVAYVVGLA